MENSAPPVRWGILGTARIATKVSAAIRQAANAELTVIASRDARRAADWGREHEVLRSEGSYQAVLEDPEIDAVYIPLPNSMHREWTVRAAEAGKHVLCEKPLGLDTAEALEMADACRAHGVQLMDGVMWVHHPRADQMKRVLDDGSLGRVRRATSAFTFCFDEIPEYDIRLDPRMGGGSLGDLGWYCCRAALWAFDTLPQRVFATARYFRGVDMNLTAVLWYDDERMASFDCGFDTELRKWMEIAGTSGSLICDDFLRPWDESRPRFWTHDRNGTVAEHVSEAPNQEVAMIEAFGRIVQSGQPAPHWTQQAVDTQRMCEALARSAQEEQIVEVA